MALPVAKLVRPSSLKDQANGKLSDEVLRSVTTPGGTATLVTPADRAWRALVAAAKDEAGHVLVPFSTYRSFDRQKDLFVARYKTTFKAGVDTKQFQGKTWFLWTGHVTASPGTSNHGLGLAIDVRVVRGGRKVGIDRPAVDWLVANEHRFGFSHEIQSEKWHIRYVTGDAIPAEVLEHKGADDMTPAQEAKLDALVAKVEELAAELGRVAADLDRISTTGIRDGQPANARATIERRIEAIHRSTSVLTAGQIADAVRGIAGAGGAIDPEAVADAVLERLGEALGPG